MTAPAPPEKPDHLGHRARLRDRLLADAEALHDYELIEYVLSLATPRRDTKKIAKALLREFHSATGVFTADPDALRRVDGMGDTSLAAIRSVGAAAQLMLRTRVSEKPVLANWQALLDYLRADLSERVREQVRVLHLDTKNRLIVDDKMADGTIDEAALHVREVIRRAIELGSAAIILVHNHPSGDPQPSRADIDLTRAVIEAGKRLNITVHDHLIIGRDGHASLRAMGLM